MPAVSRKQQRFMAMCSSAAGRKKAKGKCPPTKVAREFSHLKKKSRAPKVTHRTKY